MTLDFTLCDFIRESNRIEGIVREPTWQEIDAHERFLDVAYISLSDLERLVAVVAPGSKLRDKVGMNVRIGNHTPPAGGPDVLKALSGLLMYTTMREEAYRTHVDYENLHPFMDGNGRSGRALWLWMMGGIKNAPLGFLHTFYYQALSECAR